MTSFAKKGAVLGLSEAVLAFTSMLTSVVYAHSLGPDAVGQLAVVISASTILIPFVSLGIGRANIYYLNSGKFARNEVVSHSLRFGIISGIAVTMAMTAVFRQQSDYFGRFPLHVLLAFSFGIACQVMTSLLRPVLIADLATRRIVVVDLTQRLVILLSALLLALLGWLTVDWAMYGTAAGALAATVWLVYFLRRDFRPCPPFRWNWLRETATYGLKMAASGILFNLTSSATVLLIRHRLPEDFVAVGYYTRAVAIAGLATLVPSALGPLFYAKWSDVRNKERSEQIERAARFNITYGIVAAVILILFGKYIIWLLYGRAFIPAQDALMVFAPSMVVVCLFSVFNNLLASDGRAATTAIALAGTLIIACVMTYFLVPLWGIRGAALAVLAGNLFSTITLAAVCRDTYGLKLRRMFILRPSDIRYLFLALTKK